MPDDDETEGWEFLGLTGREWGLALLAALGLFLFLRGGCESGWRPPAQLPVLEPCERKGD